MYVEARTLGLLGPEILLIAMATLLYVGGAFYRNREAWSLVALASYVGAGVLVLYYSYGSEAVVLSGPISANGMSLCLRLLAILLGISYTLVASQQTDKLLATEYLGSLMLIVVGLMLVAGANELVLLFLGFELISIPTYVLLFLGRRDRASAEATMKYFFLSILSSALLLFGLALLFGMTGTTTLQGTTAAPGIHDVLLRNTAATAQRPAISGSVSVGGAPLESGVVNFSPAGGDATTVSARIEAGKFQLPAGAGLQSGKYVVAIQPSPAVLKIPDANASQALLALAPLALVLLLAGLGFKLTAAPFHFYAPDVYQGTTNANAGLLAVAPKIAGVVGVIRLIVIGLPMATTAEFAWQLALVLAIITMTIGNVCALWQRNVRRLMAYSAIAHGGYLLLGLAAAEGAIAIPHLNANSGVTAMILYVVVYSLASLGTFTALAYLGSQRRDLQTVDELAGIGKSQPVAAAVIAVCMFSLAGLPPLAGFWGKFMLFGSALQIAMAEVDRGVALGFLLLLIVGALNAAVAAAYYLRIVSVMFFQPATEEVPAAGGTGALSAAVLCGSLVVLVGISPGSILHFAGQSEEQLLPATSPSAAAPLMQQASLALPAPAAK